MKPHKHAEIIKAWADGAEIEYWSWVDKKWFPKNDDSRWLNTGEYRIKPEPKPDVIVWDLHCRVYMKDNGNGTFEFIKAEKLPQCI